MQSNGPALLNALIVFLVQNCTQLPWERQKGRGKAPIPILTEPTAMMKSCTPIDLPRAQYGQVLANYLRSLQ